MVPELSEIESKIASLLTPEEVIGIEGYVSLGLPPTSTDEQATDVLELAANDSLIENIPPESPISACNSTQVTAKKRRIATSANGETCKLRDLQMENALLQNANLKLQREVLELQKQYYIRKVANVQQADEDS